MWKVCDHIHHRFFLSLLSYIFVCSLLRFFFSFFLFNRYLLVKLLGIRPCTIYQGNNKKDALKNYSATLSSFSIHLLRSPKTKKKQKKGCKPFKFNFSKDIQPSQRHFTPPHRLFGTRTRIGDRTLTVITQNILSY